MSEITIVNPYGKAAFPVIDEEAFAAYLQQKQYEFEKYMTASKWDVLDIYEDEGLEAVSAFVGFVIDGTIEKGRGKVVYD